MKKFALYQVEALAKRKKYEKSLETEIVRTRAMQQYNVGRTRPFFTLDILLKQYKLTHAQMDTLKPIRTAPNPHQPGEMRFYSIKDVEVRAVVSMHAAWFSWLFFTKKLAEKVKASGAVPSTETDIVRSKAMERYNVSSPSLQARHTPEDLDCHPVDSRPNGYHHSN